MSMDDTNFCAMGHRYRYLGVRYLKTDRRFPGSDAVEIWYYDAYLCPVCLDVQLKRLEATSCSYSKALFDATPVTGDQAKILLREP